MMSYFLLGCIDISDGAKKALGRIPLDLLARHAMHEHGMLTEEEHVRNRNNSRTGGEIISRYRTDPLSPKPQTVLVRTHAGWGKTTITLERRKS